MAPNDPPSAAARAARYARSRHRAQSHDAAHAETPPPPLRIKVQSPLVPRNEAGIVTTGDELAELVEHLRRSGRFAFDSEFIGELTYVPKLCLLQVASADRVTLIDSLMPDLDLTPFWELLADPAIEKIVHAGAQDIEPVFRQIGRPAANVFDTQIAAGFVELAYPVALTKLVHELVGVKLGKGLTFTHWDKRPLSAMQLRYAADDVRYLVACREALGQRLDAVGRAAWAKAESEALCEPSQYEFDPQADYQRVRGAGSLQPQGLAVLRELTVWRDAAARHHDVPARALVRDDVLIELSRSPVKSVDKLSRVRGLPRPVEQQHGQEIVDATLRGLSASTKDLASLRGTEPTPSERFRADALWAAAQCLCIGQSIDPALVTSRQEVSEFLRVMTSGKAAAEEASVLRLMQGWRAEALGEPLRTLLAGESSLSVSWNDGSLRAVQR